VEEQQGGEVPSLRSLRWECARGSVGGEGPRVSSERMRSESQIDL
jgi:hypothetical protein